MSAQRLAERDRPTVLHGLSEAEYMAHYAHDFYEYAKGAAQKMSPVSGEHDEICQHLELLLKLYLRSTRTGLIRRAPFVMRLVEARREPDIQVILNASLARLMPTYMDGPADVVIEVVSPESVDRDYTEKFREYQAAGVPEYWIVDPVRKVCRFNRLDDQRLYAAQFEDEQGNYRTPLLPRFVLAVPQLFQQPLPEPDAVFEAVKAMLVMTDGEE